MIARFCPELEKRLEEAQKKLAESNADEMANLLTYLVAEHKGDVLGTLARVTTQLSAVGSVLRQVHEENEKLKIDNRKLRRLL